MGKEKPKEDDKKKEEERKRQEEEKKKYEKEEKKYEEEKKDQLPEAARETLHEIEELYKHKYIANYNVNYQTFLIIRHNKMLAKYPDYKHKNWAAKRLPQTVATQKKLTQEIAEKEKHLESL